MAHRLTSWIAGVLIACGVVAGVYLPPRPPRPEQSAREVRVVPTAARLRAQAIADRWRAADRERRLVENRALLAPELARHAAAGGAALLVLGSDSAREDTRRQFAVALAEVWRRLGLGITKVTVGVVVDLGEMATAGVTTPRANRDETVYLLPDSTDRTTCIVHIPLPAYTRQWVLVPANASGEPRLVGWLMDQVGPCAFHAAYGTPAKPVRRWLGRRRFDLALSAGSARGLGPDPLSQLAGTRWVWSWMYHNASPAAVACLGGRPARCRDAVVAGADDGARDEPPRVVHGPSRWRRQQALAYGWTFLADVARDQGPERFRRFWTSPDRVEPSLEAMLKMPVGEWTERWQRRFAPRIPLGPGVAAGGVVLALALAAAAIAGTALAASRRQAR